MLRVLLFFILFIAVGFLVVSQVKEKVKRDLAQPLAATQEMPSPSVQETKRIPSDEHDKTSLFVPYWTVTSGELSSTDHDQYLYFGVTPGRSGINTQESGYAGIEDFNQNVPSGKETMLVVRMLENDSNSRILGSKSMQKALFRDSIRVAKESGFDGIVLDLELSAIPFDSLITKIREFNADFYKETKASRLSYGIAIYGDTFYRLRPFDIKAIAKSTDQMLIMAYDFHKSRGNPGPNFPLQGKETYGYDVAAMSNDFLKVVPKEKVTVVFGLFGYDWEVDKKGIATAHGNPLTNNEIQHEFLSGCPYADCEIKRSSESMETNITYTDEENIRHSVWFEDMESVAAKQAYLRGKGIINFSFWAHSYF